MYPAVRYRRTPLRPCCGALRIQGPGLTAADTMPNAQLAWIERVDYAIGMVDSIGGPRQTGTFRATADTCEGCGAQPSIDEVGRPQP